MRLKFYGVGDLANAYQAENAVSILRNYAAGGTLQDLNEAIELHNALQFQAYDVLPAHLSKADGAELEDSVRLIARQISGYFSTINVTNVNEIFSELDLEYADDLLFLLDRYKVSERVEPTAVFSALAQVPVPLWLMLSDRKFVEQHDYRLRDTLLEHPRNAELVIDKLLIKTTTSPYYLPRKFDSRDIRELLSAYIDSDNPHLNYLQVIAESKDNDFGVDPKLRLQAKRRLDVLTEKLFSDDNSVKRQNVFKVAIDYHQRRRMITRIERQPDGTHYVQSLSGRHLLSTLDNEHILHNFAYQIGYMDRLGLLRMPAFRAQQSAISRLLISGKDSYWRSSAFDVTNALTLQSTYVYHQFLRDQNVEAESMVAWFFRDYLKDQFQAVNFRYTPSSPGSSYLERCRHVFAEMESVAKQFTLYCEEKQLDLELMRMTSGSRPWRDIPSLVERKYLYATSSPECTQALFSLFNDQSGLTYIHEELRSTSFERLITEHEVAYKQLNRVQKMRADFLISQGLIEVEHGLLRFSHPELILVLSDVYNREAGPFGHYGNREKDAAQILINKGWLKFHSALLTSAEASYFNYFLNRSEFSDGPDLRNSYQHGTNADPEDDEWHARSFMTLLRLLISLVLKIQDDFRLATKNRAPII